MAVHPLYPLKFHPRFVEKMWGGRKIETVLGKKLPPGKPVGESWELYDFPPGVVEKTGEWVSAQIANGPLAGKSLHWAVGELGRDLTGNVPLARDGQFPILIKFLDAREDLSVQVHPDETYAAANPQAHLKSEAWYVMEHDPGARIFKGLLPGATQEQYRASISDGTSERFLKSIPVKDGDCFYLPSGTVHALGAGNSRRRGPRRPATRRFACMISTASIPRRGSSARSMSSRRCNASIFPASRSQIRRRRISPGR
jgi:mannose-6-phosphate isomerase